MSKNQDGIVSSKPSRDLSFKPRFRHTYGTKSKLYEFISNYKAAWEKSLFYNDEIKTIKSFEDSKEFVNGIPELAESTSLANMKLHPASEDEALNHFKISDANIKLKLKNDNINENIEVKLKTPVSLKGPFKRNALLINTGGHITSMKWLFSGKSTQYHYLGLSVISNHNGIDENINDVNLSLFKKPDTNGTVKSAIQIWRYDSEKNASELIYFIITDSIGATNDLAWAPVDFSSSTDTLGVLVGTFTSGHLHLLKIPKIPTNNVHYFFLDQPSFTYRVRDFSSKRANDMNKITSYDFIGKGRVLVGLSNGYVAEFLLPFFQDLYGESDINNDFEDELNVSIPSFMQRVSDSAIFSISIGEPEKGKYVLFINTSGIQNYAFEYNNISQAKLLVAPTNSTLQFAKNNILRLFLGSYAIDAISVSYFRNLQDTPNVVMKVNGAVSALSASEILGHPLSIIGSTSGEIYVLNYARKFLNGAKTTNKSLVPLRLWKFYIDDNDDFALSSAFEQASVDKASDINPTPPKIIISSSAWNDNIVGNSVYAAGTVSGLLLIERLDPNFN